MKIIALILLCLIIIEVCVYISVKWLRRNFQWLIISSDLHPILDEAKVRRFFEHGADPELGWVRKPLTNGIEKDQFGEDITYNINHVGARVNPGYEDYPPSLLAVGDSFTFGRQVKDDETWLNYISRTLNINCYNFGVGNYGLDQSVLRMKRELPRFPVELVIFAVVPETICRIQSFWKHYCEYGNTFAFKPRFTLEENGELNLHLNPVNTIDKFLNYYKFLPEINPLDRFYKEKFLYDLLRFPYIFHIIRSAKRNVPLIAALLRGFLSSDPSMKRRPFQMVLDRNNRISAKMYNENKSLDLMEALVTDAAKFVRYHGAEPIFCMLPQLQDIKIMRKEGVFYNTFFDRIRSQMKIIDVGSIMSNLNPIEDYYTDDIWGGHFSVKTHELIGQVMSDIVKEYLASHNINIGRAKQLSCKVC